MKVLSIKSQLSIPKLIKILCPNVKPIMHNESFCKEIGILSLSKKDIGTYLYKNFQTLENFVLQELNPEYLKIELVDEFDNPLQLKSGPPTLVKAHLTSAEMNTVIVRVSSHKNH